MRGFDGSIFSNWTKPFENVSKVECFSFRTRKFNFNEKDQCFHETSSIFFSLLCGFVKIRANKANIIQVYRCCFYESTIKPWAYNTFSTAYYISIIRKEKYKEIRKEQRTKSLKLLALFVSLLFFIPSRE